MAMLHSFRTIVTVLASVAALAGSGGQVLAQSDAAPLQLEIKMPLGDVRGRIDHMAVDLKRQRLFVAELRNNSVGNFALQNPKLVHRVAGLKEPQGVGFGPP